jgi:hypothetical protein
VHSIILDSESKSCIEIAPNSMKFINVDLENCESRLTLKQEITKVGMYTLHIVRYTIFIIFILEFINNSKY